MATPESKVKAWAVAQYSVYFPGHWRVAPRGGPFGLSGCPDHLLCWRGAFIAIEVKADDGVVSALQTVQLRKIREAGGVAAVLRGKDHGKLALIQRAALAKVKDHDVQGI